MSADEAVAAPPGRPDRLRAGAVGAGTSTVFSLASTAPAYSLAVTVGLLASLAGSWAPLLLAASAVPIALVVLCFAELNDADPDCGTCYAWTSAAFGPRAGWMAGWLSIAACVLVMGNLAQTAAVYALTVAGADTLAGSRPAQAAVGLALLVAMAWLAHRGITVAARTQVVLFSLELLALVVLAGLALAAEPLPATGGGPGVDLSGVVGAFLVAVFLYCGWHSSFSVNEESTSPTGTPRRSALAALAALALLYGGFTWATTAWAGVERLSAVGEDDLFAVMGATLMGSTGGRLLAGAVLVSALASAQTTILPSARSAFSMARSGALPPVLARVSRHGSPSAATWAFTALSGGVYVALVLTSDAVLADSIAATGILISAYYAATCAAVPATFRSDLRRRPVRRVLVPAVATAVFAAVLAASLLEASATTLVVVLAVVAVGAACSWAAPTASLPQAHQGDPR